MKNQIIAQRRVNQLIAVLLTLVLAVSAIAFDAPTAYAADEPAAPATSEAPPSGEPAPSEAPPSGEPAPSEEPPSGEPAIGAAADEIIQVNGMPCLAFEVIVKLKSSAAESAMANTLSAMNSAALETLAAPGLVLAGVPEGETVESFISALEAQPDVEYAQPNYCYTLDPTDTGTLDTSSSDAQSTWFNDPYIGYQWCLYAIRAFDAWDFTQGSASVRVAVIDSGINKAHPEFSGQIVAEADTVTNDGNANDTADGHGTHVAGIIAAKANNAIGIAGIAPGVKLIAVDVFDGDTARTSDIVEGIQFAVANGAKVINMSFGGNFDDIALRNAVDSAVASGVVCVAAAGNGNTSAPCYPSDYESVISVTATDWNDAKADFSNYGAAKDIAAPGVEIWSTFLPGYPYYGYAVASGTSMSAPVVSGVVALMLSRYPGLTVNEVKDRLYAYADDLGAPGKDEYFGYGRVNALRAIANPVGISYTKTDSTLLGSGNGSVTLSAWGGETGGFLYSLDGSSWQSSNYFGGVSGGAHTAAVCDANYPGIWASCAVTVGQPASIGNIAAKKLPGKPNAGTALTIVPPAAPKGYTITSVTYSSSNPAVATVDAGGNVTFLAGGKATIITKVVSQMTDKKGKIKTKTTTAKKAVTVQQPVASISLSAADATIARKAKLKLTANLAPSTASNKKLTWKSSNPKVAAVSSAGVVTGKAGGTAVITCTAKDGSGASASCTVTVTPIYPTGVKLNKAVITLKLGKGGSLKATVLPKTTDFKTVTWTSSNPAVVTVDAKGKLKAIAAGTAVITATTSTGLSASCTVTVP